MMLSVCITTYNTEKYIDEALKSVLRQEYDEEYEILIGDDGSQDGTIEIIKHWINMYPEKIKLYSVPRNSDMQYDPVARASANRLNLMKKARGKYITFLDGDDFYTDRNKFKRQIDVLENPQNMDCVMCAHNMNFYYEEKNIKSPMIQPDVKEQKIKKKKYWQEYFYIHCEAFVFRNIYSEENMMDFDKDYFDDNLIVFYFLKYGDIYYIPDIMANYRQNETPWKTKEILEKYILNSMDYSIEKKYNPDMKWEALYRHYTEFKYLFKKKYELGEERYKKYSLRAEEKKMIEVSKILEFSERTLVFRIRVVLLYYSMAMAYMLKRIIIKCQWLYNGVKTRFNSN